MSGLVQKAWLADRFDEGLVFLKSVERGKCFIEYLPAEKAWNPIEAPGYMYIGGKRKERIGSFPGTYGNRGSGLERVSFDDERRPLQAECAQHRAYLLTF